GSLTRPHAYGDAFALSPCVQAGILSLPRAGETTWHSFCSLLHKYQRALLRRATAALRWLSRGRGRELLRRAPQPSPRYTPGTVPARERPSEDPVVVLLF